MRVFILAVIGYVVFASSCLAAPLLSGEITEELGRRTSWSVYDEFAIDNPLPSSGEFTYVYGVENVGTAPIPLWRFQLAVDANDLSSTEISGAGLPPNTVSPGFWQWGSGSTSPLNLAPGQHSIDLVVTSSLAPGPVSAFVYSCNPFLCFIGSTAVVGPAVPEPATWLHACLLSCALLLRQRQI